MRRLPFIDSAQARHSVHALFKYFVVTAVPSLLAAYAIGDAQRPDAGPLIAGESSYITGLYVATDYVYDDRGADANGIPGGDTIYPDGLENAADIVQVQLEPTAAGLSVRVLLQTLVQANIPSLVIAIDTDNDPETGAIALPGSSWQPSASLGIDTVITLDHAQATLSRFSGDRWVDQSQPNATIDTNNNTIELTVADFDSDTAEWRVFVAAGLALSPIVQGGPIYDLAFLKAETVTDRETMIVDSVNAAIVSGSTAMWQDHRQAAVLAGQADPAIAAAVVDISALRDKTTKLASANAAGWHTLLFRSKLDLGEGIDSEAGISGSNTFSTRVYQGRYQPYLVHRNASVPDPSPLVVFLHGAGTTHMMNTYWFQNDDGGAVLGYPAITVFPLARGETLSYRDIAEFDVLEVIADSKQRFSIDDDRVVLAGISMGGMGTYKMASLYPDLFAGAIAHVGHGADAQGIIQNLLNLPFRASNGMLDYLVNANSFLPDREHGMELGYDFRFYDVIDGHHQIHPHLANCLYELALATPRQSKPARVRYAIEANRFRDDPTTGLHLKYDRAYWLTDIKLRVGAERGVVDVTSLARADRNTHQYFVDTVAAAQGRDFCGENSQVQLAETADGGSAWRERSVIHSPVISVTTNGVDIEMQGVQAVSMNLDDAELRNDIPLDLHIRGDGISTLNLLSNWRGKYVLLENGSPLSKVSAKDGVLAVDLDFSGVRSLTLAPKRKTKNLGTL